MKHTLATGVVLGATAALVLSACGAGGAAGGSGGDSKTIKVAYMKFGTFTQLDSHMKGVKKAFEAAHTRRFVGSRRRRQRLINPRH